MLRTDDVQARVLAAQSLSHLGFEAKAAVPDLLTLALFNANLNTSAAAVDDPAEILGKLRPTGKLVILTVYAP